MDLASVIENLKHIDEISLLEVLEITSEEIVDRFMDKIEYRLEDLELDFEQDEDDIDEI